MPTYDYNCKFCDEAVEIFQSIVAKPLVKCPACNRRGLVRQIGSGAGIIFKGSGFYQTDYKNNGGSDKDSETTSKSDKSEEKPKASKDKVDTPKPKTEHKSKE